MTPLQKGMVKTYFRWFLFWGYQTNYRLTIYRPSMDKIKFYIIAWVCMPIMVVYDYYLRNREKRDNKPATIWVDALKLFMVCLLCINVYVISLNYTNELDGLSLTINVVFSAILSFGYLWDNIMTPPQKGVAKAYLKWFFIWFLLSIFCLLTYWPDVDKIKFYIVGCVCLPILYAYDYYLRNRKKEENKPAAYWTDALKLFMVCLLVCVISFVFLSNTGAFDWFRIYFSIPFSIIFSGIFAFKYFWDMKKNK